LREFPLNKAERAFLRFRNATQRRGIIPSVIPTILIPSFLVGRWWTIPVAAILWTVLLLVTSTIGVADIPAAAGFAAANATVGVVVHQALRTLFRQARRREPSSLA
jgi:hypothetical protein